MIGDYVPILLILPLRTEIEVCFTIPAISLLEFFIKIVCLLIFTHCKINITTLNLKNNIVSNKCNLVNIVVRFFPHPVISKFLTSNNKSEVFTMTIKNIS